MKLILILTGGPLYTRATKAPGEDNTLAPWTLTGESPPVKYFQWNIFIKSEIFSGVTSFGSSFCGDRSKPAVFTRVAAYIDWIRGELKP